MYDNVVRTLVPFVISDELLEDGLDILSSQLEAVSAG